MNFDPTKLKPGLSMSRVDTFESCKLRFALKFIQGEAEPMGELATIGSIAADTMREIRIRWLEAGADVRLSLPSLVDRHGEANEATEEQAKQAYDILYGALNHMELLTPRNRVAQWFVEQKLAFDRQWNHIRFRDADAKGWGTREQIETTLWRQIMDYCWVDVDGEVHVEDDKALAFKDKPVRQLQSYAFTAVQRLGLGPDTVVHARYNLLNPRRFQELDPVTAGELSSFPEWVSSVDREIRTTTEFPPTLCKECDYCGFVSRCPAMQTATSALVEREAATLPEVFDHGDVVKWGLMKYAWGQWSKLGDARAKAYVQEHGEVEIPGTGKKLSLSPVSEWEATALDALNVIGEELLSKYTAEGMPQDEALTLARQFLLSNLTVKRKPLEKIAGKIYPMSGKGVTKEVKEVNGPLRKDLERRIVEAGTETPRASRFGLKSSE